MGKIVRVCDCQPPSALEGQSLQPQYSCLMLMHRKVVRRPCLDVCLKPASPMSLCAETS